MVTLAELKYALANVLSGLLSGLSVSSLDSAVVGAWLDRLDPSGAGSSTFDFSVDPGEGTVMAVLDTEGGTPAPASGAPGLRFVAPAVRPATIALGTDFTWSLWGLDALPVKGVPALTWDDWHALATQVMSARRETDVPSKMGSSQPEPLHVHRYYIWVTGDTTLAPGGNVTCEAKIIGASL